MRAAPEVVVGRTVRDRLTVSPDRFVFMLAEDAPGGAMRSILNDTVAEVFGTSRHFEPTIQRKDKP